MSQIPQPTEAEVEAQLAVPNNPADVLRWKQFVLVLLNAILNKL